MTRGLTRVGACWTVQGKRTTSFGSRRRCFSGSSSMQLASRAPRPARVRDTPWSPWATTSSYSEGGRAQVRMHACWPPSGVMSDSTGPLSMSFTFRRIFRGSFGIRYTASLQLFGLRLFFCVAFSCVRQRHPPTDRRHRLAHRRRSRSVCLAVAVLPHHRRRPIRIQHDPVPYGEQDRV